MPMRNVLWFDLLWQAIPDLLDEIEAIDTQRIDANGYEGSPGWTGTNKRGYRLGREPENSGRPNAGSNLY